MTHVLPSLIAGLILLTMSLPNHVAAATLAPAYSVLAATATHVVAPGDTLYSIARRYGTTVDALKAANGLTSNIIWIGQTLQVGSSSPPPSTGTYHTVVRGDTLYSLARRYGTTVDAIMRANGLTSPNIYIGQRLLIASSTVPPTTGTTYTVVRGDTLYSIARRHGTTVDALKAANNISGTFIYIGQVLLIPQGATTPTATPIPTRTTTPVGTLTPSPTGTIQSTQTPIATTTPPTATPIPTNTPTGQPPVQQGAIGQDIFVGDVRWKVLSAENLGSILTSDNPFIDDITTPGKFIRVRFEMENRSSGLLSYAGINLIDSRGRSFIDSNDVYQYIPTNERCIFENLNPNVPRLCTVIFEVAADSTGLRAKVGDLEIIDDEEALIDLGF